MKKSPFALALLACAALTPAAFAQDAKPAQAESGQSGSINFIRNIQDEQFRSSNLVGMAVYNTQDENIGTISDLILDRSGRVAGVAIGVGGFLGIGQSDVVVPMNSLKFVRDDKAMASSDTGAANGASGRAATGGEIEKQPGSAGSPSGTSTTAALPNQDTNNPGSSQQSAAEGATQAKQAPGAGNAMSSNDTDAKTTAQSSSADANKDTSREANFLDGMKVVLNSSRDDLTNAPKLGEAETKDSK